MTLLESLEAKNAKTLAWVAEDPTKRWACTLHTDLADWAEWGITTADELEKYLAVSDVFESTRSLFGYKPSWATLMEMTLEELDKESKRLSEYANSDHYREQLKAEEESSRLWEEEYARECALLELAAQVDAEIFHGFDKNVS
jgi:hypothetical protein